jgi:cytochrome c553
VPVVTALRAAARVAAALLVVAGTGAAQAQAAPAAAGAPARLALCAGCHGADGNSALALSPSLAGQPRVFLENTLILVREGLRPIAAMKGLLDGVTDAEIVALADHFSRQAVRADSGPRDDAAFRRGEALASRNLCGTCHLPSYAGQQQMPRLAGQRSDYLAQSMREFRDNRTQGRDTQMNGVLRGYSDRDIDDLAHFFAQLR